MLLLDPKLVILDEIDSGLDIDGHELFVKILLNLDKLSSLIVLTLSPYIGVFEARFVHIMIQGKLLKLEAMNWLKN